VCGFCGFVGRGVDRAPLVSLLRRMTDQIAHRGPDDEGIWTDEQATVALGHRRLSILDLSASGHQPMASASGRYLIVFNGEVYNHAELRLALEADLRIASALSSELADGVRAATALPLVDGRGTVGWRGHSDTEVMLAAFERWGVEASLKRFVGMFAFAVWDRQERALFLARDRLGEKPLYFGWAGGVFLFGSELKALRAHSSWRGEVDRDALALLMRHNYIPGTYSIYREVRKLPPGTFLRLSWDQARLKELPEPVAYWSVHEALARGRSDPFQGNDQEAIGILDTLLRTSVASEMVADVPLGAFLSGGIDSSTVVALMQVQSARPVKTFTIGFHEPEYDEAEHAKAVAQYLGTEHTELYVSAREAMGVVPTLPQIYDEPFSDPSQIPTFLVSRLARQRVTVSLSGDGGDELFGGYGRYAVAQEVWGWVRRTPRPLRRAAAELLRRLPLMSVDILLGWLSPALGRYGRAGRISDKLRKAADLLLPQDERALYREVVSHWKQPNDFVLGGSEPTTVLSDGSSSFSDYDYLERMMAWDQLGYLPDDILVKVDRAAMAVSLETRVPILDHRVVEFAWRLPLSIKARHGESKWLLRQVLYRYVPKELVTRPKMGFAVPIDAWLRGPLRDWAEALLDTSRLQREGFFSPQPIRRKWGEHLSGQRNWQYHLWNVLMFQAWLETVG